MLMLASMVLLVESTRDLSVLVTNDVSPSMHVTMSYQEPTSEPVLYYLLLCLETTSFY